MLLLNRAYCKEVWLKGDFECYGVQTLNVRTDVCIAFGESPWADFKPYLA